MKKLKTFGTLERINGRLIVKSNHILEASIYLTLNCYIYSYYINEELIEYIIAGDDIKLKSIKISGKGEKINSRNLVEMFNYLVDYEASLLKAQGGKR